MMKQGIIAYKVVFFIVTVALTLNPIFFIPLIVLQSHKSDGMFAHRRIKPSVIDWTLYAGSMFSWVFLFVIIYSDYNIQHDFFGIAELTRVDGIDTRREAHSLLLITCTICVVWFYIVKLFWDVLFREDYIRNHQLRMGNPEQKIERSSNTHLAAKSLVEYFNLIFWFVILYKEMIISGSVVLTKDVEMIFLDHVRESFLMMVAFGPDNMQAVTWPAKFAMLAHSFTGLFMTGVLFSRLFHIEDRE